MKKQLHIIHLSLLVFIWSLLFAGGISFAASKAALVKKGNTLFDQGKYDDALNAYEEASVADPESPYILYNKGTALYKKEDYPAAREAFLKSALKSKDISLEAKARFNAGLCYFREGERQKDSDLQKTLDAYGSSIQSFQDALNLDPNFTEAAENIEMVRLMMKSILDEIKKQEEAAKKQQEQMQEAEKKIKELIQKQEDLLNQSRSVSSNKNMTEEKAAEQNKNMADAQRQLEQETQSLSQKMADQTASAAGNSGKGTNSVENPSKKHLDESAAEQEHAIEKLNGNDTTSAADHQEKSLASLKDALDALKHQKNKNGGQQQQKSKGNQQPQNDPSVQQPDKGESSEKSNPQAADKKADEQQKDQPPEQAQAYQLSDDPNSILQEEKENKKHRNIVPSGGFKEVDKDW